MTQQAPPSPPPVRLAPPRIWPNRHSNPCKECTEFVDRGEGVVVVQPVAGSPRPKMTTLCAKCAREQGFRVPDSTHVTLALYGQQYVVIHMNRFLGGERYDLFKSVIAAVGVRWAGVGTAGPVLTLVHREKAFELSCKLAENGFTVGLDEGVRVAFEVVERRKVLDVESASARVETIHDKLAKRGLKLYPFQVDGVSWLAPRERALLCDEMGLGKLSGISEPVLTPSGWRRMGDLRVGDYVMGSDGWITRVTGVFPQGVKALWKVTMTDGAWTRAGEEHLWAVETPNDRFRRRGLPIRLRVHTTGELRSMGLFQEGTTNAKWFVPLMKPARFATKELSVDPYVLGALLANGHFGSSVSHSGSKEQQDLMRGGLPRGVHYTYVDGDPSRATIAGEGGTNPLMRALRSLGLDQVRSFTKFIPEAYFLGDVEQRLALLQGLMDNDGTVHEDGMCLEYNTVSPKLAEGVLALVRSLGGSAWLSTREPVYEYKGERLTGQTDHRIRMAIDFCPFRLTHKRDRFVLRTKYPPAHAIASIEPAGEEEAVCIRVDAPDHLYVTRDCILTHNTIQAIVALPSANKKALEAADRVPPPVLIVCKGVGKAVWQREIMLWRPDLTPVVLEGMDSFRWPEPGQAIIMNYDILPATEDLKSPPSGVIMIGDEAHMVKNAKAKRTVKFRAIGELVRNSGGRTWILTGTPLMNKLQELWAMAQAAGLGNEAFGTFKAFKEMCGCSEELHPCPECGHPLKHFKGKGCSKKNCKCTAEPPAHTVWGQPSAEVAAGFARIALRRRRVDVLPDLPGKSYMDHPVKLTSEHTREVDAELAPGWEEALAQAIIDSGGVDFKTMSSARRVLAEAKVGAALELAEDFMAQDEPLVVFSCHSAPLEALGALEGWAILDGSVSEKKRAAAVTAFQAGQLVGLACNVTVAGTSITLTRASHALFVDQPWNPGDCDQCEDRLARIGQKRGVMIHRLVADHALDRRVTELLDQKRQMIAAALDGKGDGLAVPGETARTEA